MPNLPLRGLCTLVCLALAAAASAAPDGAARGVTWRGINPDMLSGGLFAALEEAGELGPRATPRAAATYANLGKGRPPAVLDPRVGANIRLGDDPDALLPGQRGQAEPHIARSAANPALLLATYQEGRFFDAGAASCGYSISQDGGITWSRALIPALTTVTGGPYNRATDPVAAIGPQGDLYLNTLGSIQGAFTTAAVVLSRSTDSGATWSAPVVIFASPNTQTMPDKNWLAVNDQAGTPNAGQLVATWTNFTTNPAGASTGNNIMASVSDDRGATWSAPVAVTPAGSSNQGSLPVFLPDGSLALVYVTFLNPANNTTQFSISCKRSTDGGRTFPAAATVIVPAVNGWDDPDVRDGVFLPAAAVARTSGELFVCYTAVVGGTPRVLVAKSADQGASWSAPVIASDNPAGISVMNAGLTVSPDGRTVAAVFMDKRNASDGRSAVDHYAALSFDGGATWQPNVRLTEMSSELRFAPQTSRGAMLGDYIGIAPSLAVGQPCVAAWCDTRTGDADPFTVRFLPNDAPSYAGWAFLRGLPSSGGGHLDDDDADGVPNYLEFLGGTDPLRPEPGQDLVVRASSATSVDVAWAERRSAPKVYSSEGIAVAPWPAYVEAGFGMSAALGAQLPPDQLPAVPLVDGLEWHGVRVTVPAGAATAFARAYRFSAGLPVTASQTFTTVNTDARLINVSTRGRSGPGAGQMIVGFVLEGNKTILVRAAGPALRALGVTDALSSPQLTLSASGSDFVRTNSDWRQGASAALFTRLGAFAFPADGNDAALVLPLTAQNYTATVSTANNGSGVVLVEAYDADAAPGAPENARLLNLSTRGEAGAGDNALIAGFVVSGTQPRRVLVRAIGPSLVQFGLANFLADPVLTVFRGEAALARNDDWQISRSPGAIAATAQRVGAFALPSASLDAALLLTLAPGPYTAVISSADGSTGVALVEIYDAN